MVYYRLAKSNSPLSLSLQDKGWCCTDGHFTGKLFLINEDEAFHGIVEWSFLDAAGSVIDERRVEGDFATGSRQVDEVDLSLPETLAANLLIVRMQVVRDGKVTFRTERIYGAPDFTRAFHADQAELLVSKSFSTDTPENGETRMTVTVQNTGSVAALCLRLKCQDVPFEDVYWKDNYVTILPGESRTITAILTNSARPRELLLRAWNYTGACQ
jgi:hypothetical protein